MSKLSTRMTLRQFDHGYWYATEIKRFARSLGVPAAQKLRKDELEKVILVNEYVRLNRRETTYRRVPSGRYINFLSDFMAANPGASMAAAVRAWKRVKRMNSPKDYRAFTRIRD